MQITRPTTAEHPRRRDRSWGPASSAAGLAFVLAMTGGCATSTGGSRLQEGISTPFVFEDGEQVWHLAHAAENDSIRIMKWTRSGEAQEEWTELVTVYTFNKAAPIGSRSLEEHFAAHREEVTSRCPGSTLEILREEPDLLYELRVIDCAEGGDEHIVGRVIDRVENRFVVQYAVRPPASMTPERREEWLEKLSEVEVLAAIH